jgi:hypothetical protein
MFSNNSNQRIVSTKSKKINTAFIILLVVIAFIFTIAAIYFLFNLVVGYFAFKSLGESFLTASKIPPNPCGTQQINKVKLNYPLFGGEIAHFTTSANVVYVTAGKFSLSTDHPASFNFKHSTAEVYVGPSTTKLTKDEWGYTFPKETVRTKFNDGEYGTLNLMPGEYWLWASGGSDLQLIICK